MISDIKIGDDNDLVITADGDFDMVSDDVAADDFPCTAQAQTALIVDNPGDYKQNPAICVGAGNYADDNNVAGFLQAITEQFVADGMNVGSVVMGADGKVRTEASF